MIPTNNFSRTKVMRCVCVAGLMILILLLMGRQWWCALNDFAVWIGDPNSAHTSQHIFDPYSFSHVQHGLLFFFVLGVLRVRRLEMAMLIESLWEIVENTPLVIDRYREATIALGYTGDTIANSTADLLSCVIGFYLASKLPGRWSLALYLFIEAAMIVTMRDSLFLNVLMLLAPVQAIRDWQAQLAMIL